jgi:hypothetical protein
LTQFGQKPQFPWKSGAVHPFVGMLITLRTEEAPHVNKDRVQIPVFWMYFIDVTELLGAETNE